MLWLGVTGGIASGKSALTRCLRKLGFAVIDADEIAHQVLSRGRPAYSEVLSFFGAQVLGPDDEIDRKILGSEVFSDQKKLQKLESIVHPKVQSEVSRLRAEYEGAGSLACFYDVPLLYEKSLQMQFDKVIVVWCSEDLQRQRMRIYRALSEQEISQRLAAQIPLEDKRRRADYVVPNEGTLEELAEQAELLTQKLQGWGSEKYKLRPT